MKLKLFHRQRRCSCCMLYPNPASPNGGHKMSCVYGERHQTKVTGPIEMLFKYPPAPQD
jgi:hypothetical protein